MRRVNKGYDKLCHLKDIVMHIYNNTGGVCSFHLNSIHRYVWTAQSHNFHALTDPMQFLKLSFSEGLISSGMEL